MIFDGDTFTYQKSVHSTLFSCG